MPRYRLDRKVWTIERVGKGLVITTGGKKTARAFLSEHDADAAQAKLIAEKVAAGFQLVPSDPRHAELEAAIIADPEAATGYAVLGDWLQTQGDPRGELIGLQIGQKSPGRAEAIATLMREHSDYLLGPLAKLRDKDGAEPSLSWKYGFIHRAELASKNTENFLAKLLAHPSGRFLVELRLTIFWQETIDTLAARERPSLRRLIIDPHLQVDLAPLWPALPELRRLELTPHSFDVSTITLPKLEWLHVHIYQPGPATANAIATAPWPKLQVLKLGGGVFDLRALLDRNDIPALTQLVLSNQHWIGKDVGHLAGSALATGLEALSLVDCEITDDAALELARNRDRFQRIVALDVTQNPLREKGMNALRAAFPNVRKLR